MSVTCAPPAKTPLARALNSAGDEIRASCPITTLLAPVCLTSAAPMTKAVFSFNSEEYIPLMSYDLNIDLLISMLNKLSH